MSPLLTPAAERALAYAAQWRRPSAPNGAGSDEVGPAELLLGLLAEPECRAALLTAARGIDIEAVRARWPELESSPLDAQGRQEQLSPEVLDALQAAEAHLFEFPAPHVVATEHLLLGLATGQNEVAQWLATRGWDTADLAAEIDRAIVQAHDPLVLDLDLALDSALAAQSSSSPVAIDEESEPADESAEVEQLCNIGNIGGGGGELIAQLRILDAAANRAGEAARVIEDYARFVLDDRYLAGECKALRHGLTTALSVFPSAQRHLARETRHDVGTSLSLPSEQERIDIRAVVGANFKRLQQGLRSLEEYAKPSSAPTAAALEALRYRAYTLERAIDITADSLRRLSTCRLYVLVDGRESAEALAQWVDLAIAAGVDVIQLRDKNLSDRELLKRARVVRRQTLGSPVIFIMNDRPDIARLAGADGVHVGQDELSVKEARTIVGPDALVGVSTHSVEQAREAVLDGANYIGVGPIFPSQTKEFVHFPGLDLLRAVQAEIRLPAFAIGGISLDNVAEVRACGCDRIAVSGAVTASPSPTEAVAELKKRLA